MYNIKKNTFCFRQNDAVVMVVLIMAFEFKRKQALVEIAHDRASFQARVVVLTIVSLRRMFLYMAKQSSNAQTLGTFFSNTLHLSPLSYNKERVRRERETGKQRTRTKKRGRNLVFSIPTILSRQGHDLPRLRLLTLHIFTSHSLFSISFSSFLSSHTAIRFPPTLDFFFCLCFCFFSSSSSSPPLGLQK